MRCGHHASRHSRCVVKAKTKAVKKKFITIEVVQSQYDRKLTALCIEGRRFGIDAGPWKMLMSFTVSLDDLKHYLTDLETDCEI